MLPCASRSPLVLALSPQTNIMGWSTIYRHCHRSGDLAGWQSRCRAARTRDDGVSCSSPPVPIPYIRPGIKPLAAAQRWRIYRTRPFSLFIITKLASVSHLP